MSLKNDRSNEIFNKRWRPENAAGKYGMLSFLKGKKKTYVAQMKQIGASIGASDMNETCLLQTKS